jgi:hypothetical protein
LLKTLVTQSPVLWYFNIGKPIKISVDVSSGGLGAVILQNDQPVAYASKALYHAARSTMHKSRKRCWL